ncbi:hypothetical protein [Streptomyces nigrescens]|uniref:hypothetical protein n=1 Tax=Streptomyces nigrescens TaxID=1920 RepID=UPI0036B77F04
MTRIPDAVAIASLDTHRLIITVPNDGPAEVSSNLPGPIAADVLRQIADQLERHRCGRSLATGKPCPVHDATDTAPQRPAGLDDLLDAVAAQLPDEEQQPATEWVADVRSALAFNQAAAHPTVITLRDVLLDDAPRTPEQALAAALVLLAAHTRELSALAGREADDCRDEHGVNRSTRGLLTGMSHTRKLLDRHANGLDAQAPQ